MDSSDSSYYSRQQLDELFLQMIAFFSGDPKRIQHFMKVHSFARIIGTKEGLDETSLFILEAAAYTHDIGIRPAEEKYGRCDGKLQEQEGGGADSQTPQALRGGKAVSETQRTEDEDLPHDGSEPEVPWVWLLAKPRHRESTTASEVQGQMQTAPEGHYLTQSRQKP